MILLERAGAVVLSAVAMASLLFAAAAFAMGMPERTAVSIALMVAAAFVVALLMRRDARRRRAAEALLPPELRPAPRRPRAKITFPIRETAITFAAWYVAAVVIDALVTGSVREFTMIAIAPFAAFMLTTITIAGRHMAFRLTAEEAADAADRGPSDRSGTEARR